MTATAKSVLFVDYDSLYLSLRARDPGMARRFASRPGAWLDAIESGLLISPATDDPVRRRILMRRCYADPKLIGKARDAFAAEGFQIVDCPPLPGRDRNSAEVHMVLDTIDAIAHPTAFDEFILLTADSDLTPVMFRLRSHNRETTIYATATTSAGYRTVADGVIDENALIAVLAGTEDAEAPETDSDYEASSGRSGSDLAALARRVHQATNVPLFPPKVYAELFRALAQEVAERGYHFQATAENVAARLVAGGRNASRRQVAFVVKGLALKGHVFSVADTAERLAEVFKEQVLYLARSAGLEIDDTVERQIQAWVVDRAATSSDAASMVEMPPAASQDAADEVPKDEAAENPAPESPEETAPAEPVESLAEEAPVVVADAPTETIEVVAEEDEAEEHEAEAAPAAPEEAAAVVAPVGADPVVDVAPPVRPELREADVAAGERKAPPVTVTAPMALVTPGESVIVLPPPASEHKDVDVPQVRPPSSGTVVVRTAAIAPPPVRLEKPAGEAKNPLESSLIAAIAEAVDVRDFEADEEADAVPSPEPAPEVAAEPALAEGEGDIGDEIQRILKAYSQNRRTSGS